MARVKVDLSGVNRKLSAGNMQTAKYTMMNQMLIDMQNFVPNDKGILQLTGTMGADRNSLEWNTPYAKAQFYGTNGKAVFFKYTTAGTGKRWDLRAKSKYGQSWSKVFVRGLNL